MRANGRCCGDNGGVRKLSGRLLVATPSTGGDVFTRGVVLMLQHDEAGAHGLVLNKPLGTDISSILPDWQQYLSSPELLFQGGPVGLDTALGLASLPADDQVEGVVAVFGSVGVVDLDHEAAVIGPAVARFRVFAGYAGWGPGQLESELERDAWYVVDAEVGDVFTDEPEGLWSRVLARQPGSVAWAASFPDDPRWN